MAIDGLIELYRKVRVCLFGCSPFKIMSYLDYDDRDWCPFSKFYLNISNLDCQHLDASSHRAGNYNIYYKCAKLSQGSKTPSQ